MPDDIKATLWRAANHLRAQMDPAEYKHIVLGLIFLKYISDTFAAQQKKVKEMVSDPDSRYYLGKNPKTREKAVENRKYYKKDYVFWVPEEARWERLREQATQPDIGSRIDDAMTAIENENPDLHGKLDKRFGRAQLAQGALSGLINLVSEIGFGGKYKGGDFLGEVYEYFLGEFASAEGKRGGQFYTPVHIVKTLVESLCPTKGRVYDPCCGSGGMFVQSENFVQAHGGDKNNISIWGQESNPTTWRLAAMNLAIRGFSANLGTEHADTFGQDQFPGTKFDYVLANPPFNVQDWGGEHYEGDPRWKYGRPPVTNANYAWLQHILSKLRPGGQAGVVLANGSLSASTASELAIRTGMVKDDVVEAIVALPGQLFFNTAIPACLWFLTNDKTKHGRRRRGETLFIDARNLGQMETRVQRILTDEDIAKIADTIWAWRSPNNGYEDVLGFCKSVSTAEIEKHEFMLTPGRYVGMAKSEEEAEPFEEKMARLVATYRQLTKQGYTLDKKIEKNFAALGYEK